MKVGLHSWSRRQAFKQQSDYDIYTFLDEAAAWGFESVEIMTGKAPDNCDHIPAEDIETLKKIVAYAKDKGISVHCWSTYNDFSFTPNEEWRLQNIAYIKKWIVLAKESGVPNLRFLTGYIPENEDLAKLEQMVIDGTKECIPLAEEHGINLSLENHNAIYFYADGIHKFREIINSPRLTTCPDPSNGFKIFEDDCADSVFEEMYANLESLAPLATNSHIKIRDRAFTPFDLERVITIYHKHNYDGPIHLEMIGDDLDKPEILGQAREHLASVIEKVQGAAV